MNVAPSSEIETSLTPGARSLLAEIRTATDAGHAYPDPPAGDARNEDAEELTAEGLIEPVAPADGGGWLAVAPE